MTSSIRYAYRIHLYVLATITVVLSCLEWLVPGMITPYLPLPILWLVMGIGLLSFNDSNRIGTWLMRAGAIVMMLFVGGLFFLELYQDGLSARALLCAMVLMIIIMFQDYGKKHESLS